METGCLYLLDWTTGLDYWTGPLDWTTGLTFDLILAVLCKLIHYSYYGVERFFVSEAVQRLQTTTMPKWSTAIVQTPK